MTRRLAIFATGTEGLNRNTALRHFVPEMYDAKSTRPLMPFLATTFSSSPVLRHSDTALHRAESYRCLRSKSGIRVSITDDPCKFCSGRHVDDQLISELKLISHHFCVHGISLSPNRDSHKLIIRACLD